MMSTNRRRNGRGRGNVAEREVLPEPVSIEGKLPPFDSDAECAVISACLLDARRIRDILWLQPEHFYGEAHRRIWEAALWCFATGVVDKEGHPAVDVMIVGARLKDTDRIAQIGGMAYLSSILNSAPSVSAAHVEKYARIVADKARVRRAIAEAQRFIAMGYVDYGDVNEFLFQGSQRLVDIANTSAGRLRVLSIDQLFAPIPRELPWIVKGLKLIEGRVALVAGYSYTGKTLLAQSLALSIISGHKVWGQFDVQRRGTVGHLNWDQDELSTSYRYQRLARAFNIDKEDLREKLQVVQYPELTLESDADFATVRAFCRDKTLVIIDALVSAAGEISENDPAIARALYRLNAISGETKCCILVVHHAGKTKKTVAGKTMDVEPLEQLRGSSSIGGACGSVFVLERTGKNKPVRVIHAKTPALAGSGLEPFALRFQNVDIGQDENAGVRVVYVHPEELEAEATADAPKRPSRAESARDREREKAEAAAAAWIERRKLLLETIKANPGDSANDLAAKVGGKRANVGKLLAELKQLGLATDTDGGWRAL